MSDYKMLLKSMGFLIIIILLAYVVLRYGLKSVYRKASGGRLQVLERVVLDPKTGSALHLVRLGREVLLLGSAQGGVKLLKTLSEEEYSALKLEEETGPLNIKDSFAQMLSNLKKGAPLKPGGDQDK